VTSVALTGATGFIGSVLLRDLREQGLQVKALYRPTSGPPPKTETSVLWQAGDLADLESLRAFVSGADIVVHCAGAVRGTSLEHFKKVNTDGVARLLAATTALSIPRFLLISSLAAREPALSAYATSKMLGEDVLKEYSSKISWDILRPPAVYGPGDREMRPLLRLIKSGLVPIIGNGNHRFSLIYVDDLASAATQMLRNGPYAGQCLELHDGHPDGYSWRQIATITQELNGRAPRCVKLPRRLLLFLGAANLALARLAGYQPMLTPGKVRELLHPDWVCDNSTISEVTGWQPRVNFPEGMKRLFN